MKRLLKFCLLVFILMNILAFVHAYKFTHFSKEVYKKTKAEQLSFTDKLGLAITGVSNPRPRNTALPNFLYKTITLQSNYRLECWVSDVDSAKATVLMFHGYTGEKSGMLDRANEFIAMGYNVMLCDFMGAGGSEGNKVTIGYEEAENVKTCYEYLRLKGEKNIYLFGTSMGAVAILRAISNGYVDPRAIIIECPYGSMYETVVARFKMVSMPSFPMAGLLVFWGGAQNGFWGFSFKPTEYAKKVKCPALLLYGEQDDRVSRNETDEIFKNLGGYKVLHTYPNAGHENYLIKYKEAWVKDVSGFLNK